jgi:hypothetical protein|nr:MAG TPA: hypothetical protein [Caudoviricetes sp.]
MATIPIENAKRMADLTALTEVSDSAMLFIHDGNGIKKVSAGLLKKDLKDLITAHKTILDMVTATGAGAHNSVYRGKNLGAAVTAAQWAAIQAGTFDDMYIGDYWVIGGVTYRIAAFDYYLRAGDTDMNTHHVTLVPDANMYTHCMNDTNITTGGYVGSKMYTQGLNQAKTTITSAFGAAHILTHRQYLCNAVTNGKPSGGSWYDSTVELMTEQNCYGGKVFGAGNDGSTVPGLHTVDKSQFPLFTFRPDMISNRQWFWLRDVVSAPLFASVARYGPAASNYASSAAGVRPAFSIKS